MSKRNGLIECYRFFAAISIAFYHYEYLYVGVSDYLNLFYIWVEFFFVISGYFLAINCDKAPLGQTGWTYLIEEFKKIYPLYFVAFIFSMLSTIVPITGIPTFSRFTNELWLHKYELLCLSGFGLDSTIDTYNNGGAATFIPALFFSTLVLYYFHKEHKHLLQAVIAPTIIIGGLSHILTTYGHFSVWKQYEAFFTMGIIRALVDMCVGILFADLVRPNLTRNPQFCRILTMILTIGLCTLVFQRHRISLTDLSIFIPYFGLLIVCLDGLCLPKRLNMLGCYLGRLSFPVFFIPLWNTASFENIQGWLILCKGNSGF